MNTEENQIVEEAVAAFHKATDRLETYPQYRHYTGRIYTVLVERFICNRTNDALTLFVDKETLKPYVRPVGFFKGKFGKQTHRFIPLDR